MEEEPLKETDSNKPVSKQVGVFHSAKSYTHYILEFILVFLAVVLGFLAESFRDYLDDRSKEKVYVNGLIRNLQDDLWQMDEMIELNHTKLKYLDTVSELRTQKIRGSDYGQILYRMVAKGIYKNHFFKSNNSILSEMKFTGKLTLLPREVIDSLSLYDRNLSEIYEEEVQYEHHSLQCIEFLLTLADNWRSFNGKIEANEKELRTLINECENVSSSVAHYTRLLVSQKTKSKDLMEFLKNRYDITYTESPQAVPKRKKYY